MRIRVLEVIPTLRRAGAERMVASLARHLDRARFDVAIAALYDRTPGDFEDEIDVPVRRLGKRRGLDLRMIPRLARVFRDFRPDLIHTHSFVLRYVLPAAWLAGRPAIVHTVHNIAVRDSDRAGRVIHRWAFRRRVATVAVAGEVARSFRALFGRDPAATIPNGIDAAAWRRPEARAAWRNAHGFSPGDVLIVSAARLEPQKNPLGLIDAFAQAGDARLLVAGEGSLLGAARARASDRVHFLGVRSDLPELLSAADVFALASEWEGNPLSVMEAMAAGLPVVAPAVGGVPELVVNGETGLLAPPGDTAALGAALSTLASDAALRARMGQAARARAQSFDVRVMADAYAALFERILKERS
jgi:glycosyltransferase involved in cell wall biosynthesis